ncbi:MAG: hypothetical protein DMG10_22810 [Acidobacteria bacterium]|nr:MAG: hypothetical protein DMG10_22810 [Acidobacteriota bacterium]
MRHGRVTVRVICSLFVLLFALSATLLAQRADRAAITGVVSDPSGSNVPGATVRIRNDDTGVETALTTNTAGAYTSPSLVLGTYAVTVEMPGFKTAVRSGIVLSGGLVVRQDFALELGTVSERVEVSAQTEVMNATQADVTRSRTEIPCFAAASSVRG